MQVAKRDRMTKVMDGFPIELLNLYCPWSIEGFQKADFANILQVKDARCKRAWAIG